MNNKVPLEVLSISDSEGRKIMSGTGPEIARFLDRVHSNEYERSSVELLKYIKLLEEANSDEENQICEINNNISDRIMKISELRKAVDILRNAEFE